MVVDDEDRVQKLLKRVLQEDGYGVRTVSSGQEALEELERDSYDVVLTDLNMPVMNGMDLLKEIKGRMPEVAVILITAFGTVESAVQSMQEGAFHYITKPFKLDEVRIFVQRALREGRTQRELAQLRREVHKKFEYSNIIGKSKAMQEIFRLIGGKDEQHRPYPGEERNGEGTRRKGRSLQQPEKKRPFCARQLQRHFGNPPGK